jgi:hypothetical protein
MCGAALSYLGRGRRPIYCSTRCKNKAANVRAAIRDGAPVVEVVHVVRQRPERPSRATATGKERRDAAAIRRIRRSPRLQRELFDAIAEDVDANRYWYTDSPRSPWHSARSGLARLANTWLPYRHFDTPEAPASEIDEATLAAIMEQLERDDMDAPE